MSKGNKTLLLAISAVAMLIFLCMPTFSNEENAFFHLNRESDLVMLCVGSVACAVVAALLYRIPIVQKVIIAANVLIIAWFIVISISVVKDYDYLGVGVGMVMLFIAEICNLIVLYVKTKKDSGTLLDELK